MFSERMQILLTPAQRRRLEVQARLRGLSVAAVVREAIDAHVEPVSSDRRVAALERLRGMRVPYVPVDELNAMLDDRD